MSATDSATPWTDMNSGVVRDAIPLDQLGAASITPDGDFEAGSYASFTLTYTAGLYGIDDSGSLRICFRFASDQSNPQFDDPKGANYTVVEGVKWRCAAGQMGPQGQCASVGPHALDQGGQGVPDRRRNHYRAVWCDRSRWPGDAVADLLRGHVRVSRVGRPDRDVQFPASTGAADDRDRAWCAGTVCRRASDPAARGAGICVENEGRGCMGQPVRQVRYDADHRGGRPDRRPARKRSKWNVASGRQ